jgi:hypothetical protein
MLGRLFLALILCGLGGVAYAGDAGASPPSTALAAPSTAGASPGSDPGRLPAGSGSQDTNDPSSGVDVNGVHMSLHMMGGAVAGGAIRP